MLDLFNVAKFIHLLAFAGFAGASFTQQRMLAASARPGRDAAARDSWERAAAAVVTRAELPAILLSVASGLVMLWPLLRVGALTPALHVKLTLVGLLAILAHIEMFSARKIVRLRTAGGPDAEARITAARKRHAVYGAGVALGILGIVWIVVMYL